MRESRYTIGDIVRIALLGLAALLALSVLGVVWQVHPQPPALPKSWTASMSIDGETFIVDVLWLALTIVLLFLAFGLAEEIRLTIGACREAQLAAFAARVLPKPIPPVPLPPHRPAYANKYVLTLAPREPAPTTSAATLERERTQTAQLPTAETIPRERTPSISILGPPRIQGAQPRRGRLRSSTEQLLVYLVFHPDGASTDELADAIWPGEDPKRTRPRLWQSATDARAVLGDALTRDGERYRLERSKVRIDLDELERLLQVNDPEQEPAALQRAAALWRGEPLAGCDYPWADGHIRRLHATFLDLLVRVGHTRIAQGDARGALQVAEQAIALDELHEPSWRLALQAEHALGLRSSLTQRYEQLTHTLDEQLGLAPSHETRMMYRELLGQT